MDLKNGKAGYPDYQTVWGSYEIDNKRLPERAISSTVGHVGAKLDSSAIGWHVVTSATRLLWPLPSRFQEKTFPVRDILSDILETVALKGTLYFRTDFSPPFAIDVPAYASAARFHAVIKGQCHVTLPSGEAALLETGDLVLVPYGSAHVLADAVGRDPIALDEVIRTAGYTGQGALVFGSADPEASTQLMCGHFTFAEGADHPLLRSLPPALHITAADRSARPIINDVLRLLERRVLEEGPGSIATVSRLSEVLYIEAMHAGVDRAPELKRMLSAIYDPNIGQALALIHHQLERNWTLESLALEVGMSRSRFAESFKEFVGETPMRYLSDWRLQRARALLREPRASVQEVARKTGYRSAPSFSRAFHQKFGWSPKVDKAKID
jgi:AraC-like DNA-binding protein